MSQSYLAYRIQESETGTFTRELTSLQTDQLPEGDLLIQVHYSALNYKDALSATGNKGVTRHYPHTPGIDAVGEVVESKVDSYTVGQQVLVTSFDLGMNTDGGFGQMIRVPAEWAVALPPELSMETAMILGTAGFTAGLALYKMLRNGQTPEMGPVVITGASGGVGSLAVAILAHLGYEVHAITGKEAAHEYLTQLGAAAIHGREYVDDRSGRPLVRPKWAGAIDMVGGNTLTTLLKACKREGSVASCGLVDSPKLSTTVFPFILNGVNLLGVDSATCPLTWRHEIWQKLATAWHPPVVDQIGKLVPLTELDPYIDLILQGQTQGRIVIDLRDIPAPA